MRFLALRAKLLFVLGCVALASMAPRPASAQVAPSNAANVFVGRSFTQQATHMRLYMRHYALFEEPDPGVPPGIYIDAATGLPTDELTLVPPCESYVFAPA